MHSPTTGWSFWEVTVTQGLTQGLFHQCGSHVAGSHQWNVICVQVGRKWVCHSYFLLPCQQGRCRRSSVNLRDPRWQWSYKIGGIWVSESLLWQTLIWTLCERHLLKHQDLSVICNISHCTTYILVKRGPPVPQTWSKSSAILVTIDFLPCGYHISHPIYSWRASDLLVKQPINHVWQSSSFYQ